MLHAEKLLPGTDALSVAGAISFHIVHSQERLTQGGCGTGLPTAEKGLPWWPPITRLEDHTFLMNP